MPKRDKVIVIIPSYNSRKYWDDLLPTLTKEKYEDFDWEILVVDNNSSDDSVSYLEQHYPEIKVIVNKKNLGYVGANNVGYEYAQSIGADFIYLLNQDTVIEPGFLQPLYNFAKEHKFGSLQSKIRIWSPDNSPLINSLGNDIHYLGFGYATHCEEVDDNKQEVSKINYASGAGVFISMSALSELGYLFDDTMFMYLEDLDLGWSLRLLGYDNYLIPQSIIYHKYEFDRTFKQVYWFERNRLWVSLKNYKLLTILLLFPAWLVMEIGQWIFAVKNKYWREKLKAYQWLIDYEQWEIFFSRRRNIQTKRKVNDREICRRFTGKILFQPLENTALKIANIVFNAYWQIVRILIIW